MADTWTEALEEPVAPVDEFAGSPTTPTLSPLVERALARELAQRRELRPHAQLGVSPSATPDEIDAAYRRLQRQYDPKTYATYGRAAVVAAEQIAELLRQAHDRMRGAPPKPTDSDHKLIILQPRVGRDETQRALETLRGAIARRLAEAEAHATAGRLTDAIRVFESVLVLDRSNEVARTQVAELRPKLAPPTQSPLKRFLLRLFRR